MAEMEMKTLICLTCKPLVALSTRAKRTHVGDQMANEMTYAPFLYSYVKRGLDIVF